MHSDSTCTYLCLLCSESTRSKANQKEEETQKKEVISLCSSCKTKQKHVSEFHKDNCILLYMGDNSLLIEKKNKEPVRYNDLYIHQETMMPYSYALAHEQQIKQFTHKSQLNQVSLATESSLMLEVEEYLETDKFVINWECLHRAVLKLLDQE